MNKNMQYTEEWFNDYRKHEFDWKDLKAIKQRLGHLSKMMDELNELLKNGDEYAQHLAIRMNQYAYKTVNAIESDKEYINWGRADMMKTY